MSDGGGPARPHVVIMRSPLAALLLCGLAATAARAAVFDVTKYGAKGDNATDDTAGVRAAFAAAKRAGGGTVLFPTGKAFLSGPMNVSSHTGERRGRCRAAVLPAGRAGPLPLT